VGDGEISTLTHDPKPSLTHDPCPLTLMAKRILFISIAILSTGCAKVANLNELLTLKGVADSQTAMAKDVEATNKRFDALVAAVKSGAIEKYATQEKVKKQFGVPILEDQRVTDTETVHVWMYRNATEFFGSDKVYLYFDQSGKLKESKFIEGHKETAKSEGTSHGQIRQETPQ